MSRDVSLRLPPDKAFDGSSIRRALHLSGADSYVILRRSIDARRKDVMVDLLVRINPEAPTVKTINLQACHEASKQAVIVGSGPAGLFAALTLLEHGIRPIVLERGKDVHSRRLDIAGISRNGVVNPKSNYSFGEGGAGTYSDGKLFTRSKKRGDNDKVLGAFVQFGAPESIVYDAHPHIGTDKLPKIIENMREAIISHGGEVHFETCVVSLLIENGLCRGVVTEDGTHYEGPVVLAIGNAARDTFHYLSSCGVPMEAKSLAMGVRLEHPQHLIDSIQYHNPAGRGEFLPAAEYSFATQVEKVGVYSFCMCPGGFVVPAASGPEQVVVNGMSPSNRGSIWANSGMVVEVPASLLEEKDALAMMRLQEDLERKTFIACEGTQKAPSQRMMDFINGKLSKDLPRSSYAPGLTSCDMRAVLPQYIWEALAEGFKVFSNQAHGFMTNEAILIGTETRTSSPVRILRDENTLESVAVKGLYPCGEGAGYAGGIVSAAIDGIRCALKIAGE